MSLKRGLIIFLLLTMGVSAVVIWSSLDKKALDVISSADWRIVSFALLAVFASWGCDAGRFCLVARSMGYKITFGRGLLLTWLLYFGCAVTPMQVGGGPFQLFVLYKRDGVPVGSGVAITLIRTLLSTFILSIAAPSAILLAPELLHGHKAVVGVFIYVLLLSVVVWTVFIFSVVHPETLRRLIGRFTLWLRRFKRLKRLPVLKIYRRLGQEMDSYSSNIRLMLGAGRRSFFGAVLLSVLQLMAIFSVLPILICALGLPVNYIQAISAQAMFMFILYFIPTPGASGVAEGGGAALFGLLVPWNLAGVTAIFWRFMTEYISIFLGCLVAIKLIGWGQAEKLIEGDDGDESERNDAA